MFANSLRAIGAAVSATAVYNVGRRLYDEVDIDDDFSRHTSEQHHKHPFSGMHEPYIASKELQEFFDKHFSPYRHFLPRSKETFMQQQAAVKIDSLINCPLKMDCKNAGTVVVGGPPAFISSANERGITVIYDPSLIPIARGSARHLEWDAQSEAPTSYRPKNFMLAQIFRACIGYESLKSAKATGHFSWRSLDWCAWLKHPEQWPEGIRIMRAFEKVTGSYANPEIRNAKLQEVASRCKANQIFYEALNKELGGRLLYEERGSVIVARTPEEKRELEEMRLELKKESRELNYLSPEVMKKRYGKVPPGETFAEKPHDGFLVTNVWQLIAERIHKLGGKVINGTLTNIYIDHPEKGGVVRFATREGEKFMPFSKLVLSLGPQRIIGKDNKHLFDITTARGVSVFAVAFLPLGRSIPQGMVCGATNHVIKLSNAVRIEKDGKMYDAYLLRMTAAACITPNLTKDFAHYDAVAANGLITAARTTLDCPIEVLGVQGCGRQVSEHGEGHWMTIADDAAPKRSPFSLIPRGHDQDLGTFRPQKDRGVFIQFGAGGGGLTQGPGQPPLS